MVDAQQSLGGQIGMRHPALGPSHPAIPTADDTARQ
jgi:hypothetical protein